MPTWLVAVPDDCVAQMLLYELSKVIEALRFKPELWRFVKPIAPREALWNRPLKCVKYRRRDSCRKGSNVVNEP